jgi:hypothetical protein
VAVVLAQLVPTLLAAMAEMAEMVSQAPLLAAPSLMPVAVAALEVLALIAKDLAVPAVAELADGFKQHQP